MQMVVAGMIVGLLLAPLAMLDEDEGAAEAELSPQHQEALEELAQSYVNAMNTLELAKEGDEDAKRHGTVHMKTLQKACDAATKAGLPESTRFEIGGFPETTFGKVKAMVGAFLKQGEANVAEVKAMDAAKRAPFANVLSGDKLRIFDEVFGVSLVNSGRGGKTLYTPEEYAKSDLWARTGYRSDLVPPRWSVTVYRFEGMKLVSTERKEGAGASAPSSVYQ